jgi:DNA-binding NarL/FixJ family response regulator
MEETLEIKSTTARREWFGWFGAASWLFIMVYGHDMFLPAGTAYHEGGTIAPFLFMLVFAVTMIVISWRFGRDPNGLSKVVFYTAPAAIVITAVFALLPEPLSTALYILSAVLFAPVVARRVYGVMRTSVPGSSGSRLVRNMTGLAAGIFVFTIWTILIWTFNFPPKEFAFLVPALLAIPAWLGVRRFVTLSDERAKVRVIAFVKKSIILIALAVVAFFWLNAMNAMIHANIVNTGIDGSALILALGFALPPVAFIFFGVLTDKGYGKYAFIGGISFSLVGIMLAHMPGSMDGALFMPLVFTHGLGGAYTEFFILTIPVFFFIGTKRPVFSASSGVTIFLIISSLLWIADRWLPESFRILDTNLFVSASVSGITFMMLAYFIVDRYREKSLAVALYKSFYIEESPVSALSPDEDSAPPLIPGSMQDAGFMPEERQVASLLIEGFTKGEIAHRLHIPAADVSTFMNSIHEKIAGFRSGADQLLENIVAEYSLTVRESQILRSLYEGKTNAKIAEELFISVDTAKFHVRNLMKKLSLEGRAELREWLISRTNGDSDMLQ